MQEDRVYDNLLNLPLFLGMSRNDLLEVAGHTKFDFQKAEKGLTIVKEGEPCKRLYFLLTGELNVVTEADDHGYRIEEGIKAPEAFQMECIYGYNQYFTHTYIAKKECSVMSISKQEMQKLSDRYEISESTCSISFLLKPKRTTGACIGFLPKHSQNVSSSSLKADVSNLPAKNYFTSRWKDLPQK